MNQFGSGGPANAQVCGRCEALLMDVLDRTASAEDQAYFDRHLASCTGCSRMFMDAKRGGAWLEMLRDPRPEPSATLFARILAGTSGSAAETIGERTAPSLLAMPGVPVAATGPAANFYPGAQAGPAYSVAAVNPAAYPLGIPGTGVPVGAKVLPFRMREAARSFSHKMLQPRLAMTAAMAFFSIALTLNLTGVRVTDLRASDLRPSSLRRGFHEANAHVVRYYDNLRVVYELEARVHDMQRASDQDAGGGSGASTEGTSSDGKTADPAAKPGEQAKPEEKKAPQKPGPGTSLREPVLHEQDRHEERDVAALDELPGFLSNATQGKGDRS